jgi:hypothetical protein
MRRALLACPLLLLACGEKDPSTGGGADSGDEIVIDPPEEDDEEDPGPVDADGDGHDDTVDCDDGDAEVHPDATEAWNGVDDDCDGRRDADGSYRGTLSARATAVYEGDDYAFDLACTAALERDGPDFTLVATCPTDAEDEMAQLLLGASLVLQVEEDLDEREAAWTEWEGRGVVRSSDGWDTWLDTDLAWDGFDTVALSASRSAASLAITAQGSLSWEPPEG